MDISPPRTSLHMCLFPGRSSQIWGWGGGSAVVCYSLLYTGRQLSLSCGTRLRVCLVPGSLCFLIGCRSAHAWAQAGSFVSSDTSPVESPGFPSATAASVGDTALSLRISFTVLWPVGTSTPSFPVELFFPDSARLCATFHVAMVSR